jgi:hypothetical protein
MYKVYKRSLPQYFIDLLEPNSAFLVFNCGIARLDIEPNSAIHHHHTRKCSDYYAPFRRLIVTSNSMRIFGVKLWNSMF